MKTIRHYTTRFDALSAVTGLMGHGIGKTLDADTWMAASGRVIGIRYDGPRDWAVVELTKAEGAQVRLGQLARLADEHMALSDGHERRALELIEAGNEGLARARRSQAAAHRTIAGEWLLEMRELMIETTGETVIETTTDERAA